ncbi:unnamed protein product [Nesidiocoris tenuis]|uniref:Uncharacterized protein n=1 Tax=Nesidiocoris tenuis TaxID=355587 RepID=A0A6H5HHM3_9HEMI|nr:unnamed protein product [Nesidiocoris tenuis]
MFKKDVPTASAGDRVGVGVTHFDSKLLETGVASEPGYFGMTYAVIVDVRKVMYFKFKISSGSKYHISVGHDTVIGKVTLFKAPDNERLDEFSLDKHYEYVEELVSPEQDGDQLESTMALLELEQEIPTVEGDLFIASKLDVDINKPCCRIAFHGHILKRTVDRNFADKFLPKLSIYKWKEKEGLIDRVVNDREIIVTSLFKKETQMHPFLNLRVRLTTGENGVIKSTFGAGGKVKVELDTDLNEETKQRFTKKTRQNDSAPKEIVKVQLKFKKYLYNSNKTVKQ